MKLLFYISAAILLVSLVVAGVRTFFSEVSTETDAYTDFPTQDGGTSNSVQKIIPTSPGIVPEETVPFNELVSQTPTRAFQSMLDSVHLDSYAIFPCQATGGQTHVVMFTAKYTQDPVANTFEPAVRAVADWESDALQDIGRFIYPGVSFAGVKSFFVTSESDTALKVSATQVGSTEYYLYAKWVLNYVFYASSRSCLDEITSLVYGVH